MLALGWVHVEGILVQVERKCQAGFENIGSMLSAPLQPIPKMYKK